eukprot:IDg17177t1
MASAACSERLVCLAGHPGIVFGAYIAAFLPLTVIYALDFISPKWKSIRETRNDGIVYLISSILPLAFVIFYIHLQKLAKDYKEMATAKTAAMFCSVHIMRTIWGFMQLHLFKEWCIEALHCLMRMGYEAPVYEYGNKNTDSEGSETEAFFGATAFETSED